MKLKNCCFFCLFMLGTSVSAESESLETIKNQLRKIYKEEISTNKNDQAILSLNNLRKSISPNEETNPYIAGISLMIYIQAKILKDSFVITGEILNLYTNHRKNKFIYLEYYQSSDKLVYDFWKYGIVMPTLNLDINKSFSNNELPSEENLKEIFELASEFGSEFTGRLNGESSTTSYGDLCVHMIYFNKLMPLSKKISELKKYTKILGGSGLGNAYLSLALLKKETKNKNLMKQYSKECVRILKNEDYFNPYNDTKQQLCEEMLE